MTNNWVSFECGQGGQGENQLFGEEKESTVAVGSLLFVPGAEYKHEVRRSRQYAQMCNN